MMAAVSKKLINDPSNVVNDCLQGFVTSNANVLLMKQHKVVLRKDIETLKKNGKVCLISGGGSGHEPAHAGYIGEGMLTAAVCGDVFASPPSSAVLAAIRACSSPAGVLLIVKNYTGDRLHFGKAAERAKAEGIKVEMVVIGEDCALTSKDKSAGRRGLCGTVFVHKIAGAMAESGFALEKITEVVRDAIKNMGTMSISLSPCSVPGQAYTFQIPKDSLEFGLGIHGEPGVKRIKISAAKYIVQGMIDHLLQSEYMPCLKGKSVAVIVNNLGGMSNLEMSLVTGEVLQYLRSNGLFVDRCFTGAYMTSLEMAGVSITLMATSKEILKYLDQGCNTSGWQGNGLIPNPDECFFVTDENQEDLTPKATKVESDRGRLLFSCLQKVCETLLINEQKLNELDRAAGDGDCGTTLGRGGTIIKDCLGNADASSLPLDKPEKLVLALATLLESAMGGTSGAIFSLFLTACASSLKSKEGNEAISQAMADGIHSIKKYGAAEEGDRTLLDALCPAARTFNENVSESLENAFKAAAKAASDGAKGTANMVAKAGRSSYIAASNLTAPDPGAVAVSLIFDAIASCVAN